ncbi:hypothetical protein G6F40_014644 [Rhizopus arrhizus]|nr:hypothetical protein G6F40_014644 [Rhizopus arrhizus]
MVLVDLAAGGLGVVQVGNQLHATHVELVVPAERIDLVLALVVHAAHQRIRIVDRAAGEAAIGVAADIAEHRQDRIGVVAVLAVAAEAQLELVGGIDLLGFGVERVEGAVPAVVRPELDGGHHAIALVVAGAAQRLDAIGEVGARRDSATLALVGVLGGPRLPMAMPRVLSRNWSM